MRIPKAIVIKGQTYQVKLVSVVDDLGSVGECNSSTYEIKIHEKLPKNEQYDVFLHECFHAGIQEVGLKQTSLPHDLEEILCELFMSIFKTVKNTK